MKRYIKSAIAEYITLKDCVETNIGVLDDNICIVVRDFDSDSCDHGAIEYCTVFDGTFWNLCHAEGCFNFLKPFGMLSMAEYWDNLSKYEVSDVYDELINSIILSVYYNGDYLK